MSAKRARTACTRASEPCPTVPLHGRLQDETDMNATMAKLVAMNITDEELGLFARALGNMQQRSSDGVVRFGSLCSGSGLGDLVLHVAVSIFQRSYPELPDFKCSFMCELEPKKAHWLENLGIADVIFKDVTQMGLEIAPTWRSSVGELVPDTQILFFGFSCRDVSIMNSQVDKMTQYVIETLPRFVNKPDAEEFDPHLLADKPLLGSTVGTLIGALQYLRKHLPDLVLMENVAGVMSIMPLLKQFLERLGYCFSAPVPWTPKSSVARTIDPAFTLAASDA